MKSWIGPVGFVFEIFAILHLTCHKIFIGAPQFTRLTENHKITWAMTHFGGSAFETKFFFLHFWSFSKFRSIFGKLLFLEKSDFSCFGRPQVHAWARTQNWKIEKNCLENFWVFFSRQLFFSPLPLFRALCALSLAPLQRRFIDRSP